MTSIALNGATAIAARVSIPRVGVWVAEVDLDLPASGTIPSGRASIALGSDTLLGTVDPRGTGKLGAKSFVRILGGAGGWDKPVSAIHIHNDFGVTSTAVYTVTATEVGETVVDAAPRRLGVDYARAAGPASRVLRGSTWWIDGAGVTRIGPRASTPADSTIRILDWDPLTRRATIAADGLVWPGTVLTDTRFGSATVRDVEAAYDAGGSRVVAWCDTSSSTGEEVGGARLARAIGQLAQAAVPVEHVRTYAYRIANQGVDGRVSLVADSKGGTTPDALQAVPVWLGVAGVKHTFAPGTLVRVAFLAGDPTLPIVIGVDAAATAPTKTEIDAAALVLAGGVLPVALATPSLMTWIAAVTAYVNGVAPGTLVAPTGVPASKVKGA